MSVMAIKRLGASEIIIISANFRSMKSEIVILFLVTCLSGVAHAGKFYLLL